MYQNKPNCIRTNQTNTDVKEKVKTWGVKSSLQHIPKTIGVILPAELWNSTYSTNESFFFYWWYAVNMGTECCWIPLLAWLLDVSHCEVSSTLNGAQEMKYKRSFLTDHGFTFFPFFSPQKEKSTLAASLGTSVVFHIVGKITFTFFFY